MDNSAEEYDELLETDIKLEEQSTFVDIDNKTVVEELPTLNLPIDDSRRPQTVIRDLICKKFGFDDKVYNRVMACGLDIESLLLITDNDINDLFPVTQLGIRAKFKYHLNLWRGNPNPISVSNYCKQWLEQHFKPSTSSSQSNTCKEKTKINPQPATNPIVTNLQLPMPTAPILSTLIPSAPIPSAPIPSVLMPNALEVTNLQLTNPSQINLQLANTNINAALADLLNSCPKGIKVLEYYKLHKILDDNHRDIVTSVIVDSYTDRNKAMTMSDIVGSTNAIKFYFPTENIDYYLKKRGNGLNPIGKLHDKAVNARVKLRRVKGHRKSDKNVQTSEEEISPVNLIVDTTAEEALLIKWLQENTAPWSEIAQKWSQVSHIRQYDIKHDNTNIFTKWRLLKSPFGHRLIDMDYNIFFKDKKQSLFSEWPTFAKKIIPFYQNQMKDNQSVNLLQKLDKAVDENSRDCILFYLLHSVLKPSIVAVKKKDGKRTKWKPTIVDSQDSTLIHCTTFKEYLTKLDLIKEKNYERNFLLPPLIIVIGEDKTALTEFYMYYEGIFYKFDRFLNCLDIIFKFFHVMNFEYPLEGKNVYAFLESYFYSFGVPNTPNVTRMIDHLTKENSEK